MPDGSNVFISSMTVRARVRARGIGTSSHPAPHINTMPLALDLSLFVSSAAGDTELPAIRVPLDTMTLDQYESHELGRWGGMLEWTWREGLPVIRAEQLSAMRLAAVAKDPAQDATLPDDQTSVRYIVDVEVLEARFQLTDNQNQDYARVMVPVDGSLRWDPSGYGDNRRVESRGEILMAIDPPLSSTGASAEAAGGATTTPTPNDQGSNGQPSSTGCDLGEFEDHPLVAHINRNPHHYMGLLLQAAMHKQSLLQDVPHLQFLRDSKLWQLPLLGFDGTDVLFLRPVDLKDTKDPFLRKLMDDKGDGTLLQLAAPGHYSEALEGLLTLTDALGQLHPGVATKQLPAPPSIDVNLRQVHDNLDG